jgi:catechol 2,3-dioxygenase-like lactoylglutathione lyase family enzyme
MDQRLSMVTLGVSDVGRSRAFYQRLGWAPSPAGNDHVAFFSAGGMVLGLFGRAALAEDAAVPDGPTGFAGVTLAHNVPTRDAVAVVLEQARQAGAKILRPAEEVFWGGVRGYFSDPDGHLWEVAWNPHFPLDAEGRIILP